jgi:excisionase family DNA binding protein
VKPEAVEKLAADIARLIAEREPEQLPAATAPPLLTARAVAARLQTNVQAVYRLAREGELPPVVLGTRSYRWTEDTVAAFIERRGAVVTPEVKTLRLVTRRA